MRNNDPRCECNTKEHEEHTCPFRSDIWDDEDFKCTCCEFCEQECADDI